MLRSLKRVEIGSLPSRPESLHPGHCVGFRAAHCRQGYTPLYFGAMTYHVVWRPGTAYYSVGPGPAGIVPNVVPMISPLDKSLACSSPATAI